MGMSLTCLCPIRRVRCNLCLSQTSSSFKNEIVLQSIEVLISAKNLISQVTQSWILYSPASNFVFLYGE